MEAKKEPAEAHCARCGAAFGCGAGGAAPCWCAALPPLEPVPGRGCLCRACLERELAVARPD
jgi:Cysteine-rich CWC